MASASFSVIHDVMPLEKNNTRILIIEKWSFQLLSTLTMLNNAGYFCTFPVLSCVEALAALRDTKKPYDVLLCSTALDVEELYALLEIASRDHLTEYYSLFGDSIPQDKFMTFLQDLNAPGLQFLGTFEKPLSSTGYGRALARVHARKNQFPPAPLGAWAMGTYANH
ncbi:hypothetical protein ACW9H7_16910 [Pseudomonas yamanorum]|jgi:hypothetical protein|uniref:hypothetical protein n=1 Tax=Pseudomonas yamanorum TaxID=515393 RepID=UPI002ED465BF|nr:hypothetical protein VYI69_19855 [Pseudomonas yamanorum]